MLLNLKSLVVVLVLASVIFTLARPWCLRFTAPEDFDRRRKVWYILTILGFASPSFWLYLLVAAPLMYWAGRKDAAPTALYLLLLYAIPPVSIEIPIVGINRLFDLSQARILGLAVLLPFVLPGRESRAHDNRSRFDAQELLPASRASPFFQVSKQKRQASFGAADVLLLSYGLLQIALLLPYEATTNTVRRGALFLLDEYLVYMAFSRLGDRRAAFSDTLATFILSTAVMAPIAVFESLRHWLLYTGIGEIWGSPNSFAWLLRADSLRAQASAGHALPLGYLLAMAIGCLLCLNSEFKSRWMLFSAYGLLSVALYFSYSRAPWLTAVIVVVIFFALTTRSITKFLTWTIVVTAVSAAFLASPLGSGIADQLPIIGSVGQETVEYRQQLAETSWRLIQQNPWLGNPFALLDMEDLRQGEGIIDLVNAYAAVTLFYGVIGLLLFCGVFAVVMLRAFVRLMRARQGEPDVAFLGASLLACMFATLLFMATAGFARMQWQFAGLLASYAALRLPQRSQYGAWSVEPVRTAAA